MLLLTSIGKYRTNNTNKLNLITNNEINTAFNSPNNINFTIEYTNGNQLTRVFYIQTAVPIEYLFGLFGNVIIGISASYNNADLNNLNISLVLNSDQGKNSISNRTSENLNLYMHLIKTNNIKKLYEPAEFTLKNGWDRIGIYDKSSFLIFTSTAGGYLDGGYFYINESLYNSSADKSIYIKFNELVSESISSTCPSGGEHSYSAIGLPSNLSGICPICGNDLYTLLVLCVKCNEISYISVCTICGYSE